MGLPVVARLGHGAIAAAAAVRIVAARNRQMGKFIQAVRFARLCFASQAPRRGQDFKLNLGAEDLRLTISFDRKRQVLRTSQRKLTLKLFACWLHGELR
jgi:hypothetical protein